MLTEQASTRDHWWWRPGWRMGRSFYTWHITFPQGSAARELVEKFAPLLAEIPTMAPVDEDGLHVTLQGVGFADEVHESDLRRITAAAQRILAHRPPINLTIGPAIVDEETIQLPIADPAPLGLIREDLQSAIAEIWGAQRVPEIGNPFRPHLTIAYSTGITPITELKQLLTRSSLETVTADDLVTTVSLIELNRDNQRYEWTDLTAAPLTGQ